MTLLYFRKAVHLYATIEPIVSRKNGTNWTQLDQLVPHWEVHSNLVYKKK